MPGGTNLFDAALKAEGVSGKLADLARSIYTQESTGGKNAKTSNRGAVGGMQILPSTFRGVADPGWSIDDPLQNARGGIRYLKQMASKAGGDLGLTSVGYYGGPGAIAKAKQGVAVSDPRNPNAPDTFKYRDQTLARAGLADAAPVVVASSPTPSPVAPAAAIAASALAYGQGSQGAPVEQGTAPAEVVAAAPAPVPPGPDAWQEFLKTVAAAPASAPEQGAVTPASLNFGSVVAMAPMAAPAPQPLRPNFEAFGRWKGQLA